MNNLIKKGFTINLYNPCVANKNIDGKQMTVMWHIDDLMVSHKNKEHIGEFASWLELIYGNIKVQREKQMDYLGMILDYREKGKVKFSMKEYVKKHWRHFQRRLQKLQPL